MRPIKALIVQWWIWTQRIACFVNKLSSLSLINVGTFFSFFYIKEFPSVHHSFSPARAMLRNSIESANFTRSMWPIESVDCPSFRSFNKECDFFSHTVSRKDKNKKTFLILDWILIERSYKWRHQFQAIKLLVAWNFRTLPGTAVKTTKISVEIFGLQSQSGFTASSKMPGLFLVFFVQLLLLPKSSFCLHLSLTINQIVETI